ncbi:hypothetical protein K438DRAFT_1832878 [Mycena galopus ATCC 62051]|nr:hypothetical protein K438DRAFT_1832878 [Mycena galopus ATCC 62051]
MLHLVRRRRWRDSLLRNAQRRNLWEQREILSLREHEALGMWAATMKVIAGTQMVLSTKPNFVPVVVRCPISVPFFRTPRFPPSPRHAAPRTTTASIVASTEMMRVTQALERRNNAERRLRSRNRPRTPMDRVVRAAAASIFRWRLQLPRPPRPPASSVIDAANVAVAHPSSVPLPAHNLAPLRPSRTYSEASTQSLPTTASGAVVINASSPRSLGDAFLLVRLPNLAKILP